MMIAAAAAATASLFFFRRRFAPLSRGRRAMPCAMPSRHAASSALCREERDMPLCLRADIIFSFDYLRFDIYYAMPRVFLITPSSPYTWPCSCCRYCYAALLYMSASLPVTHHAAEDYHAARRRHYASFSFRFFAPRFFDALR